MKHGNMYFICILQGKLRRYRSWSDAFAASRDENKRQGTTS